MKKAAIIKQPGSLLCNAGMLDGTYFCELCSLDWLRQEPVNIDSTKSGNVNHERTKKKNK